MSVVVATYPMSNNAVRNFTFEQFFNIFKTSELDISHFWLINSGFDQLGNKRYAHLVIRACAIRPLFGPHLVSIFEVDSSLSTETKPAMRTFWVHSLTDLRRNMFCFRDRLSFERSTYLIPYNNGELLIRLKSIRAFLRLPVLIENTITSISSAQQPPEFVDDKKLDDKEVEHDEESRHEFDEDFTWGKQTTDELTFDASIHQSKKARKCCHDIILEKRSTKMRLLLNHHVQIMVSYLNRELHLTSAESLRIVDSYVSSYCNQLLNQINN